MKPILLIHGYSAESKESTKRAITSIYGDLPKALRKKYGAANVFEIDLSRYISLDDGITLDDVARGLDRVLKSDRFSHLLSRGFHTIVHSTGALVIRNWLRLFSARPSPLQNLVYLAGANFGSGWAHLGRGQLAKWGRTVFQDADAGVRILNALEFGSEATLDMHLSYLLPENRLSETYKVFEHVIIGTQADPSWLTSPIRFAREDGSDGVVRVCGSNLNFNYVRFEPTDEAHALTWKNAQKQRDRDLDRGTRGRKQLYHVTESSRPGVGGRPVIPFAIPFECAHTGDNQGIVVGSQPREQVLKLIDLSLTATPGNWPGRVARLESETADTYQRAVKELAPGFFSGFFNEPRRQYDPHAQVIFRLRDLDRRPVNQYDIFFNASKGSTTSIGSLIEHKHKNEISPNIFTFYLRTDTFDSGTNKWTPQVPKINGCFLEITATEPETDEVLYLPFRYQFTKEEFGHFIQPHRTTVIDVTLARLPSPDVFRAVTF